MKIEAKDLYAALVHELKNNLSLLAMAVDNIPNNGDTAHDENVSQARLLCQQVIDRLQQSLLIYKSIEHPISPSIDAYSPLDLISELELTAASLIRGRLKVDISVAPGTPEIWFFDRNLIEMALLNAVHNSMAYARSVIHIGAQMLDGSLAITVHDDSEGYPPHILRSFADGTPYRSSGTGLGLQLAQLIAQAHENQGRLGEVRLSNEADGATFTLLIP